MGLDKIFCLMNIIYHNLLNFQVKIFQMTFFQKRLILHFIHEHEWLIYMLYQPPVLEFGLSINFHNTAHKEGGAQCLLKGDNFYL